MENKDLLLMRWEKDGFPPIDLNASVNYVRYLINEIKKLRKQNIEQLEALEKALPYVDGAYECAFPDQSENDWVKELIESAINKAKGQ